MNDDYDSDNECVRPITSNRRRGNLTPKISRTRTTLFICSDCYSSIHKEHCNIYYYCRKCNLKLCKPCYDHNGNTCVQGCKKISIYINPNENRPPEDINSFIEVVKKKDNSKCGCFNLFFNC